MAPLTIDDLFPIAEFSDRRGEYLKAYQQYIDQYRRVVVDSTTTLIFENRQTLWFKVQDILRVARLTDPKRIAQELHWYNCLLPRQNCLQAAMLFDPGAVLDSIDEQQSVAPPELRLVVGGDFSVGRLSIAAPEDRCSGATFWLEFALSDRVRSVFVAGNEVAAIEAQRPGRGPCSTTIDWVVRKSLIGDLLAAERGAA